MKELRLLTVLLATLHLVSGQNTLLGSAGRVQWILTADDCIEWTIEMQFKAWVGLGWHASNSTDTGMVNGDYVYATFDDSGHCTVLDGYVGPKPGPVRPDTDFPGGTDDILSFSCKQEDGKTIVTAKKKLVTNDTVTDFPINNAMLHVIWAHGDPTVAKPNVLAYHGVPNRGLLNINFFVGNVVASTDILPYVHGSLMVLGYGFCMTFGIFIARYLKNFHWWFPLHILVQVLGVLLAIGGFALALIMSTVHFATVHSWFGLSVLGLSVLAPVLGWASDLVYDPSRTAPPIWPDQIHWWVGRATVIFSFVTIILGMVQLGVLTPVIIVFGGFVAIALIVYFFVDIYRACYSKESSPESGSLLKDH